MRFHVVIFFTLTCLSDNSLAQIPSLRTLSIDSLFQINFGDSTVAENCTRQTAKILDSLETSFNYSFIENFKNKNYTKTNYKIKGTVYETNQLDDNIYINQKFYFMKIDFVENVNNKVVSTKSVFLKNLNNLLNTASLDSVLRWIIIDSLTNIK
jgi:hypothetical protein